MKILKIIFLVFLFSSCNRFDEMGFYKRCSKVLDQSAGKEEKNTKDKYDYIAGIVAESGYKPADIEIYETARQFYKVFRNLKAQITQCEKIDEKESLITGFLDSLYSTSVLKDAEIKDCRSEMKLIFEYTFNKDLKKAIVVNRIALLEKEIAMVVASYIGTCDLKFYIIQPYIIWEKDTVTEGDSLKGKVFIYTTRGNTKIHKVEINNISQPLKKYDHQCTFSLNNDASMNFNEKGEITKHWEGKVFYRNRETFEDTIVSIHGDYIIQKACK